MSNKFDIIVVGGGMVGLAMCTALAGTSLKILLVEKQNLESITDHSLLKGDAISDEQFDTRVSAISPGNRQFLSTLGAWQEIPQTRLTNYDLMKVWDGDGSGYIEFSAAKIAQADLGVIVENRVIQAALIKKIQSASNIEVRTSFEISEIESLEKELMVRSTNETLKCNLLIGADGANSSVREKLKIELLESDYNQTAFVANVKTELPHQNTAWQRFTPFGPVAFLPLANENLCSVVWSLDKEKADQLIDIPTADFVKRLQYAFESRLGKVTAVSKHFGFPLLKRHSKQYLSHRVALVGDSAHTIHPLAGQGVNLGFQDVECLSELIGRLIKQNRDYGLVGNLRSFERERKTENLIMQNAMSGFKKLFANQSMPVTLVRNFAMSTLNSVPIAKEVIIKKAMGL